MTIQDRFTLYMIPVLAMGFGSVLCTILLLPYQLDQRINAELRALAQSLASEVRTDGEALTWTEGTAGFGTASSFFVVTDETGQFMSKSDNLPADIFSLDPDTIAQLPTKEQTTNVTTNDDHVLRVLTFPFTPRGEPNSQPIGYLQIGRVINDYDAYRDLETASLYVVASSFFFSLAAIGFIMPRVLKHLSRITDVAEQITSADDLSRRIDEPTAKDDITILVRVLNRLMERLEGLFRTQQRLIGDVSHELRTPLTTIRGNVDLIRHTGEATPESLSAIDSEARRMSRLIEDLLTLARADVSGLPIVKKRIDLDRIVLEVYEQMLLQGSDVQVHLGTLDQVQIMGDTDRLKQLFINLMTNGMKYTDAGGWVRISLTAEPNQATVRVADSGLGIPAEDLPHIFDRFYRVNKARTRERGGSGLGLAIVKSIVNAHNGDISVTSEFGVGSTFTIMLPFD